MQIDGIYAGEAQPLTMEGLQSAIVKQPINTAEIDIEGITVDQQADRRVHGGPQQALHQYSVRSYQTLVSRHPELEGVSVPGTIGENLTVAEMDDTTVCIGDVYQFGAVILQVSQPRRPCVKIDHRYGVTGLSRFIEQEGITGWYFRVLEPGVIQRGDTVTIQERLNPAMNVCRFMRGFGERRPSEETLNALIACEGLSPEWHERLLKRRDYFFAKR